MNIRDIRRAFDKHKTDKGRDHGYEYMYSELFLGNDFSSLLEIGVRQGRSIATWQELFPNIKIAGVDIKRPKNLEVNENTFNYILCDSTTEAIRKHIDTTYDIIIDDGSHVTEDQIKTFLNLADRFSYCYVIEDIHCHGGNRLAYEQIANAVKQAGYSTIVKYPSTGMHKNMYAMVVFKD